MWRTSATERGRDLIVADRVASLTATLDRRHGRPAATPLVRIATLPATLKSARRCP